MYRIAEKLPPLTRCQGSTILNKHQSDKVLRSSRRYYDTNAPKKGGIGKPILYLVGAATVGAGGAITYAKYDPKFRKTLNEYVPGSDSFIRFISQEEKSYGESVKSSISNASSNAVNKVYSMVGLGKDADQSKIQPPPPLVVTKTTKSQAEPAPKKEPAAAPKKEPEPTPKSTPKEATKTEPAPPKKESTPVKEKRDKHDDLKKYNLPEMEKTAKNVAAKAITEINKAVDDLKAYREEVANLIEKSIQSGDYNIWFVIREKTEQKGKCIEHAEKMSKEAMQKLEHLKILLSDEKTDIDHITRTQIENNIKNVVNDLVYTKAVFAKELSDSSVSEKYAKKVEESRQSLSKELGTLFPSLLVDTDVLASDEELDLFVMYTCQLLNFYQKELQKLETIGRSKLNQIIEQAKAGNVEVADVISLEKETLKRSFAQELLKSELKIKLEFENELKNQLKRQAEVYNDHLEEIVYLKDKENERKLHQNINEKVEDMKINYNKQLAKIIGRMKGLDMALKEKAVAEKQAKRSQLLWSACQSLISSIQSADNEKSWEEQLKPLENEVKTISKAAADEDPLVGAVLAAIPEEAKSRGVYSELALRDRFLNVEKVAFRLANLPEGYVSIPRMVLSYLQSFLLVNLSKTIPPEELANEPFDISSLSNYDVLFRARYWLDRGDFLQALRYMNLLKGAARAIADEWINETRILLETKQAADVLLSHAAYSSLIYLNDSS
ncbi:MICOS complex subunit Mic60 [Planococcus citri]|uniref:MICOS complex subunit Mic60 n=1 Tax=Planococcus citri TaxID=170843 RepID=UPI0031F83BCD